MRKILLASVAALALSSTGCIKQMLTNGQISATREASGAFETIGDYELARGAAMAGMAQFEGMHKLAPDNEDALFLLMQGWAGYGFAFADDDYEVANDAGNDALADYNKKRARMAYDRAIFYGQELMAQKDDGFKNAKRNEATIKQWLSDNFDDKDDAPTLFWMGSTWMLRVDLEKDDPAMVADLFIGVAMMEQAVKLDPSFNHYAGLAAMGAYHSRTAMAEMDQGKAMFEDALAKTQHKTLLIQLNYAHSYACNKGDRALYEKLLNEVLNADDPDPQQRLTNAVAKRRAKRYLSKDHESDCGFDMSPPAAAPASPAPAKASVPAAPAKK
ncbi:MAG: TRAP transporter TatT component family protein [Polyangiaceae bacterium]